MNAKLCKRLRVVARAATVGIPERRMIGHQVTNFGKVVGVILMNDPKSTRGLYRLLKKKQKQGVALA